MKILKSRKGIDLPIKTVAMIVLGLMVVAFLYAGFSGWFGDMANGFVDNVEYPEEGATSVVLLSYFNWRKVK